MKKNKSTFVKLLKRIKKHSFFIILSLIMAAVTVATTLYVPILVGRGIDCIIGVDNVDFAKIVKILIQNQHICWNYSTFTVAYEYM